MKIFKVIFEGNEVPCTKCKWNHNILYYTAWDEIQRDLMVEDPIYGLCSSCLVEELVDVEISAKKGGHV